MKLSAQSNICFLLFFSLSSCIIDVPSTIHIKPEVTNTKMDKVVPCILVIGQSNASGRAPIETAPIWLKNNNYLIEKYSVWNKNTMSFQTFQLGVNVGSENNADTYFGFDVFFAQKYIENYQETLFCIKQTLGGVPISEKGSARPGRWNPNTEIIPKGERKMVDELSAKLVAATNYAKKQNSELRLIAILFHQGESDADDPYRLNDYDVNFRNLIKYLHSLTNNDTIPIIGGELLYNGVSYDKINEIFLSYSLTDPNFKLVNMKYHQTHVGDNLHYDSNAFSYMGGEMFDYYVDMK